jgi:hypothetical protein
MRKRNYRHSFSFGHYQNWSPHRQVANNRVGWEAGERDFEVSQLSWYGRDEEFTPQLPYFSWPSTRIDELFDDYADAGLIHIAKRQTNKSFRFNLAPDTLPGVKGHFMSAFAEREAHRDIRVEVCQKGPECMQDLRHARYYFDPRRSRRIRLK